MKRILLILAAVLLCLGVWAKGPRQTVVFDVDIHCQGCITKIEKNIAFERGVKDLECNLDDKTVTIVYDPQKTDVRHLQEAFGKIGKTATVRTLSDEPMEQPREQNDDPDAMTGASTSKY